TLVARDMALHRPGLAAVERLVEAEQVVVALGADDPLALADQMARVGRIDTEVRLGVILDAHRVRRGHVLRRVRAEVLAGVRGPVARRHAAVEVAVGRGQRVEVRRLRRVAARPLLRRSDGLDDLRRIAGSEGGVGLIALRWRCGDRAGRERERAMGGAAEGGADVLDIGLVGTEMLYYAVGELGLEGGFTVTASHNPKEYTGMKIVRRGALPVGGESGLLDVRDRATAGAWHRTGP